MADAYTNRILARLDAWKTWLRGQPGMIGEFGWPGNNPAEYWPGDAADYNALAELYYDRLETHQLWSLQWAASESFSGYELAPYTSSTGGALNTRRPQGIPLENNLATGGSWRRGLAVTGLEFGDWDSTFSNTSPGTLNGPTGYVSNSQATWNYIASRGVTLARVGFRWERIQPTLGAAFTGVGWTALQDQVTRAGNAGIQVWLDCHNYGGYFVAGSPVHVERKLGSAQLTQAHFEDLWDRLSEHFGPIATVVGFGLMNEPVNLPNGAGSWETMSRAAYTAVRANTTKYVSYGGHAWGQIHNMATIHPGGPWIDGTNLIVEGHDYWDTESSEQAGVPSQSQPWDSVYVQTYDEGVADSSPTVYIRNPQPSETLVGNPITVKGVRKTTGSTTVTVRVRNAANTVVHTQTTSSSTREWSLVLSYAAPTGSYTVQAQQDADLSPLRSFTQQLPVRKAIALPAGPTNSWHATHTSPLSGDPFAANRDMYSHRYAQAADFYDSVGINSHVKYGGCYERANGNMDLYLDRLQEAGIRHVREGLVSPAVSDVGYQWAQANAFAAKVRARNAATTDQTKKIVMLYGTPKEPANTAPGYQYTITNTNGNFLRPLDGPAGDGYVWWNWYDVAAFQGPNEPDAYNFSTTSVRQTMSALQDAKNARTAKATLNGTEFIDFRTGRIAGPGMSVPWVPVFGCAMAHANDPAVWSKLGDYSNGLDIDVGAVHIYWGGMAPPFLSLAVTQRDWFRSYNGALSPTGMFSRTLPLVCTETGYIFGTGDSPTGQRHVPPNVGAEYTLRTFGHNFMFGIKRTYWFAAADIDTGAGQPQMGICDDFWNRRAPFYAIKNQQALLGWRQRSSSTPLNVTMAAQTAIPGTTVDAGGYQLPYRLDKLVIGLDDAPDRWLIWLYPQNLPWDRTAQAYRSVTSVRWRLTLPAGNYEYGIAEPAKNPVSNFSDGITYANPTNGTALASPGVAGNGFTQVAANVLDVTVAAHTRVIYVERTGGSTPTGTVPITGTKTSRRTLRNLPSGTATYSGSRTEAKRYTDTAVAKPAISGTVTERIIKSHHATPTGTVRLSGTRQESWVRRIVFQDRPAAGRAAVTGTRTESYNRTFTDARGGTLALTGRVVQESWRQVDIYSDSPTGLVDWSGTLDEEYELRYVDDPASAKFVILGKRTESWTQTDIFGDTPEGEIALSGSATEENFVLNEDIPTGGFGFDGDLAESYSFGRIFIDQRDGELGLTGDNVDDHTAARDTDGTVGFDGTMDEAWATELEQAGSFDLSGTTLDAYIREDVVEGSLTADGTATDVLLGAWALNAEALIGGAMDEDHYREGDPVGRLEIELDVETRT